MSTPVIPAAQTDALSQASKILLAEGLVVVPTETVYGLAALAISDRAIERIYLVKGRSHSKALIAHVDGRKMAGQLGELNQVAIKLIETFWPGPLTLVVPRRAGAKLNRNASGGLTSVALRCPDHEFTRALIRRLEQPLLAPSANIAGAKAPVSVDEISPLIAGQADLVIDGGICAHGQASTLLDCCTNPPMILREGGISRANLQKICGDLG